MIWLIPLILAGFVIWAVIRTVMGKARGEEPWEFFVIVFCGIFLFLTVLLLSLWTFQNGAGLMKWQAFYQANSMNYAVAVDETASYLSAEKYIDYEALIPIEGSLEKIRLASVVSDRIVEWRNAVNRYNTTIASMQYYNRNIVTGLLVPDAVEDMKLLVIQ